MAVASISRFELAWLVEHQLILVRVAVRAGLAQFTELVRKVANSPAVASPATQPTG
ncbi:MAG TPA: hypothetical protein VNH38_07260 [Candidatus Dormibacteraeota bacterium]|nr:hypothetical protein [Candidatus Dormibacteraeota bacterium]